MEKDVLCSIKEIVIDLYQCFGNITLEQEFNYGNCNAKIKIELEENE